MSVKSFLAGLVNAMSVTCAFGTEPADNQRRASPVAFYGSQAPIGVLASLHRCSAALSLFSSRISMTWRPPAAGQFWYV